MEPSQFEAWCKAGRPENIRPYCTIVDSFGLCNSFYVANGLQDEIGEGKACAKQKSVSTALANNGRAHLFLGLLVINDTSAYLIHTIQSKQDTSHAVGFSFKGVKIKDLQTNKKLNTLVMDDFQSCQSYEMVLEAKSNILNSKSVSDRTHDSTQGSKSSICVIM